MRIFRWLLLTANVILLLFMVIVVYVTPVAGRAAVVAIMVVFLADTIFIVITWRYERQGKGFGKITGVFD